MLAHMRLRKIEAEVRRRGSLSFEDLLKQFDVSPATLRRDLASMESKGRVIRTHGGVMHPAALAGEPDFSEKSLAHRTAKKKIAEIVNRAIPDKAVLFIDGGTTCLESARLLLARPSLTLITNSVPILALGSQAEAKVISIGGELRKMSSALVGSDAFTTLNSLRADIALLGASAIDAQQAYTSELSEAKVKQSMIARAREAWLLVATAKSQTASPVAFANRSQFNQIITENTATSRGFSKKSHK